MNSLEKISLKIPYEKVGLNPKNFHPELETVTLKFSPEIGIRNVRLLLSVPPFHGKPLWILISGSLHAAGFVVLRRIALSFRRRIV